MASPTEPGPPALDPLLLSLLRCPRTGQPLRVASTAVSAAAGLSAALLTEDGTLLYPVREGLPILLPEAALPAPA